MTIGKWWQLESMLPVILFPILFTSQGTRLLTHEVIHKGRDISIILLSDLCMLGGPAGSRLQSTIVWQLSLSLATWRTTWSWQGASSSLLDLIRKMSLLPASGLISSVTLDTVPCRSSLSAAHMVIRLVLGVL